MAFTKPNKNTKQSASRAIAPKKLPQAKPVEAKAVVPVTKADAAQENREWLLIGSSALGFWDNDLDAVYDDYDDNV